MPSPDDKYDFSKGTTSDTYQIGKGPFFEKISDSELEIKKKDGSRGKIIADVGGGFNTIFNIVSYAEDQHAHSNSTTFKVIGQNGILIRSSLPSSFTAKIFCRSNIKIPGRTGTVRLVAKKFSDKSENYSPELDTTDIGFTWKSKDITSFISALPLTDYILEAQAKISLNGDYEINSFLVVIYG